MSAFVIPRALLFVPGSSPDKLPKALASGADNVCLDLEDAVAPALKDVARRAVIDALENAGSGVPLCIRINRLGTLDGIADVAAIARSAARPIAIMLPKTEEARDAGLLAGMIPDVPIIALVESARGIENAFQIAREAAVAALMFGSFDYAAEVGCTQEWDVLLPVRSRLIAAAAATGKLVIDSPFADLANVDAAFRETVAGRRLGMAGRAAIHPRMLAGILKAFTPSEEEVADARLVVDAFAASGGAVARVDGRLIELPTALRAERLLKRLRIEAPAALDSDL